MFVTTAFFFLRGGQASGFAQYF